MKCKRYGSASLVEALSPTPMGQGCGFVPRFTAFQASHTRFRPLHRKSRHRETNEAHSSDSKSTLDEEGSGLCSLPPAKYGSLDEAAALVGPSLAKN